MDVCTLGCYLHLRHKANRKPGAVCVAAAQKQRVEFLDGVLQPAGAHARFSLMFGIETPSLLFFSIKVLVF